MDGLLRHGRVWQTADVHLLLLLLLVVVHGHAAPVALVALGYQAGYRSC